MVHHLNTNKQFMVGNGILAFAVIFIVVIFLYMSLRLQREQQEEHYFSETYSLRLEKGFAGDSIAVFVNDSLLFNQCVSAEPEEIVFQRFAEQSSLLIVDVKTELLSLFDLSEQGGCYRFEKEGDEIKLLGRQ